MKATARAARGPIPIRPAVTAGQEGLDHPRPTPAPDAARFRRLTPSERRLARWLREHLGMAGAENLIREFSAADVLEALHDGIVEHFEPHPITLAQMKRRYPATEEEAAGTQWERAGLELYSPEQQRELLDEAGCIPGWRVNPELHNAGAFLRATLDRAARPAG